MSVIQRASAVMRALVCALFPKRALAHRRRPKTESAARPGHSRGPPADAVPGAQHAFAVRRLPAVLDAQDYLDAGVPVPAELKPRTVPERLFR